MNLPGPIRISHVWNFRAPYPHSINSFGVSSLRVPKFLVLEMTWKYWKSLLTDSWKSMDLRSQFLRFIGSIKFLEPILTEPFHHWKQYQSCHWKQNQEQNCQQDNTHLASHWIIYSLVSIIKPGLIIYNVLDIAFVLVL